MKRFWAVVLIAAMCAIFLWELKACVDWDVAREEAVEEHNLRAGAYSDSLNWVTLEDKIAEMEYERTRVREATLADIAAQLDTIIHILRKEKGK